MDVAATFSSSGAMLFNFTFLPWQQLQLKDRYCWFWLTAGQYWIQAGEHALFEYSPSARPFPRYCDYPVVRLYEDVLEILPYVLEPIPAALMPCIQSASGNKWHGAIQSLLENTPDSMDIEQYRKLSSDCLYWWDHRSLNTGYLSPSTAIRLWSDQSTVHIEWDNREKLLNGVPAWTAILGSHHLSREELIREVRSFHDRLMEQMQERIAEVLTGAPPEVSAYLWQQHQERNLSLDPFLALPETRTDWEQVVAATGKLERGEFY
jgi:hypothetical protein